MFLTLNASRITARAAALAIPIAMTGCPEEKPQLPDFSERVYLEVAGAWTADHRCLDVVTVTNLPQGTTFRLLGQQRHPPGYLEEPDKLNFAQYEMKVQVVTPRQEHKRIFCDDDDGSGISNDRSGMWLAIAVGGPDTKLPVYSDPHDYVLQRQEIGPQGEKLKGPSTRRTSLGTFAGSETFVLPGTAYPDWEPHSAPP